MWRIIGLIWGIIAILEYTSGRDERGLMFGFACAAAWAFEDLLDVLRGRTDAQPSATAKE